MSYVSHQLKRKTKDVAKDILIIIVLSKFVLEFVLKQGGQSITLGAALLVAGVIAIAVRNSIIGKLLSIAAIIIFLLDIYYQGGPYSAVLFGFLVLIAVLFYVFMRIFST